MKYSAVIVVSCVLLAACAGKQADRGNCSAQVNAAWKELEFAKTEGFSGTVSYSKALGLISLAKSMQTVENFDNCVRHAKDARFYIAESRKGQ